MFTDIHFMSEDGTPTAIVQAGKEVEFSVGYKGATAHLLKHVSMSIDIFAQSGQCMMILNNEMIGVDFASAPAVGRFRCRVDRFPLSPGQYLHHAVLQRQRSIADWVQQAAVLTVEAGDFFGSGRLPPTTHGGFLVAQQWRLEDDQTEPGRSLIGTGRSVAIIIPVGSEYLWTHVSCPGSNRVRAAAT